MPRKKTKKPTSNLPLVLIVVGTFLVLISTTYRLLRYRSLAPNSLETQATSNNFPTPTHIEIPWRVDVTIGQAKYQNDSWTIFKDQAAHLASSSRPGQGGNIIIYGHNTKDILGNIRALNLGTIITLTLSDNSQRTYQVQELVEVSPKEVKYLEPTATEVLTLYTCSGLFDSMRYIVRAVPAEL